MAYHMHWSLDDILELEHQDRLRFVDEIAFLYRGEILYRGPARTIADAPEPIVRQFVRGELTGPLDDR